MIAETRIHVRLREVVDLLSFEIDRNPVHDAVDLIVALKRREQVGKAIKMNNLDLPVGCVADR